MISHTLWCDIFYDVIESYIKSYILYYIIYGGGRINLNNILYYGCCSLFLGLHSGLDLFHFSTITSVQLIIHCRQHSTAQSVPFYCCLLPKPAICCPDTALAQSCACFWKALLIKWRASTNAAINGCLSVCICLSVGPLCQLPSSSYSPWYWFWCWWERLWGK
jgi:hypothetical protein